MKITPKILLFLIITTSIKTEDEADSEDEADFDSATLDSTMDDLKINIDNDELKLQTELKGTLDKIDKVVDMTFSAIDSHSIKTAWREGKSINRDLNFEKDITFYKLKETLEFPCKSVNFLFEIKSDLEIYDFNAKRFLECFLRFNDEAVKEYLSDLIVEGIVNIMKSGYSNPISTFFSNLLIIEGPLKLKEELFGSFYKYVNETADLNETYSGIIDIIIKKTFSDDFEEEANHFLKSKSTTIAYFLYDIIIVYLDNNDVYLSAYDFIQPDSNMVNNFNSMDPLYISKNIKDALEKDLVKFKRVRDDYNIDDSSLTIYHKAYHHYVSKNIEILCNYLYHVQDC